MDAPFLLSQKKSKATWLQIKPLSFFDKKLFKRLKKHASRLKVSYKKKILFSSKANPSLIKKPRKKENLNNSQKTHSIYQPTNIINTKQIFLEKGNKKWQRFKEFIKENTFFEPDPLLDWRAYGKILSSLNLYQKGGSGYVLLNRLREW